MAQPDKVVRKSYAWFREAVGRALDQAAVPAAQKDQAAALLFKLVGLNAGGALPNDPQLEAFTSTGAVPESIAYAGLLAAESIAAVDTVSRTVAFLQSDPQNNLGDALQLVGDVIKQVQRVIENVPPQTLPSAFGLAKVLLTLSGDAIAPAAAGAPQAKKLADALTGGASAQTTQDISAGLGLLTMILGAVIDNGFKASSAGDVGWIPNALLPNPPLSDFPPLSLPLKPGNPTTLGITLERDGGGVPTGVRATVNKAFDSGAPIGDSGFKVGFSLAGGLDAFIPFDGGKPRLNGNPPAIGISVSREKPGGALVIGPLGGATLKLGAFGIGFTLRNGDPRLDFFARGGKAEFAIDDSFLKEVLTGNVAVDFDLEAEADKHGKLRLKNGTGIRVTVPVPKVPTGPFKIQLITFGIEPQGGLDHLQCELSASFGVTLGPFAASVDRLGVTADLTGLLGGDPKLGFGFKPPSGVGLAIDLSVVKGGGYLYVDPVLGQYAGVLELKIIQVGVKAIAILTTKSPAGWSLLLMIYGQFPPIQLSWGFTLTGIGGLIGIQHTLDREALSRGMSNGSLDAILFPANPVADAPQIINTLRTLFPIQRGGFIIGPMLEIGWGTPSLVTVRLGLLIESSKIVLIGQAIVQLPPLLSADLALLRLQVDFAGWVNFDPFGIGFDAVLRDSRVLFITLHGQFAFRLQTGDHPTFLISAGGFHPRFEDVPSDIPQPFQRIGCGFDIGIVGVDFKGYFAVTSATVQGGSELRVWADLGICGIEGGIGFDAIVYLDPKFYFEVSLHAYVTVKVFGGDFAGVRVEGLLAGPGRWRIVGKGYLELPLLPDIEIGIDEAWGQDRETPPVTVNAADQLKKEIGNRDSWAVQLPPDGESLVSLAPLKGVTDLLAHPLATLEFRQKLLPLNESLKHLGLAKIDGANTFRFHELLYAGVPAAPSGLRPLRDYFSAAQFFDVKESERLEGPSFAEYDAGVALSGEDFTLDGIVAETLDYEEANLSEPEGKRIDAFHLGALETGAWIASLGAAAQSALRAKDRLLPIEQPKIAVNPPPVRVADRASLAAANTTVFASYWSAKANIAASATLSGRAHQVVEQFEVG